MAQVKEQYSAAAVMPVGGRYVSGGTHISGFLATAAGTISVNDSSGELLLDAMPVAVGFNRIPLLFRSTGGGIVQLGGAAAGTLLV